MSIVQAPINFSTSVKPVHKVCYVNNLVNSQGVFLGDRPLAFSLPLLLLQISLIFLLSNAIHYVLRPLGQSRAVSQVLTGILLGPTVIGHIRGFRNTLFPERGNFILDTLSHVSLIFFLFTIGIKTDLAVLKKPGRRALAVGIAGFLLPLVLAFAVIYALRPAFPGELGGGRRFPPFLAARLSLSSFPVLSDALDELRLLNTDLGRIATTAALITDISSWIITAAYAASSLIATSRDPVTALEIVASIVAFTLAAAFVGRPMALWAVRRTAPAELLAEGFFVGLVLAALVASLTTEIIGYRYTLGPMVLGLMLPGGMPIGVTMTERLDSYFSAMFLPIYMAMAGYRADAGEADEVATWGALGLVVVVCYFGKLVGSMCASLYCGMPLRDAFSLGLMVNIKGVIEISYISAWSDDQVLTVKQYSVLILSMLVTTAVTSGLVKLVYNPSMRYTAHKRRTIQHAKPGCELCLLACFHTEDNVAAMLDLLEASGATPDHPVCLTVLHLTELAGRAASVLRPYKRSRRRSATTCSSSASSSAAANPTASDRIVNAFRYFEKESEGAISVHPFVAMAPYASMHNDVCSLALDRKARLILLPFHKQSDGAFETARQAFRSLNCNVLAFAPCSVAILVDRGVPTGATCALTNHLLRQVAVYFLGGPDDREALAIAMHMADNSAINVTVVRFLLEGENDGGTSTAREPGKPEAKLDEGMVQELCERHRDNAGVVYMEKVVENGEGTAAVITSMSEKFDLLVVGRRKGVESALTSGLSAWSEYPELGVIGDMLASTDYGGKVSILVVQQQGKVDGAGDDDGDGDGAGGERGRQRGGAVANVLDPHRRQQEEVKDNLIPRQT